MNIVVTGSLGHIGKPLTELLVRQGHRVTVVSSKENKRAAIEVLGATPAIGSVEDADFLTATFTGADVAYCMAPPDFSHGDLIAHHAQIGRAYAEAIRRSGVKGAIYLSSFGAHRASGNGIIAGAHQAEQALGTLTDVAITFLRPTSFYYNFNSFIPMIRHAGFMAANYGADDIIPMVAPSDIAAAIADEIARPVAGHTVRYVVSDERSGHEVAQVLGRAIGKPDLRWQLISDEQMQAGLEKAGLPRKLAADLTEMYAGLHNGNMGEDYVLNKPGEWGRVKLEDFANQEFAVTFEQSQR